MEEDNFKRLMLTLTPNLNEHIRDMSQGIPRDNYDCVISKIKDYFLGGKTFKNRPEIKYELPLKMVIPMISRLTFLELISNYQHAWKYPDGVQGVFYFLALLAKQKCKTSYSQIIGHLEKSSSLLLYRSQIIRDLKNIGLSLIHKGLYRFELFIGAHIKPMISPKIMPKLRSIYRYLRFQE